MIVLLLLVPGNEFCIQNLIIFLTTWPQAVKSKRHRTCLQRSFQHSVLAVASSTEIFVKCGRAKCSEAKRCSPSGTATQCAQQRKGAKKHKRSSKYFAIARHPSFPPRKDSISPKSHCRRQSPNKLFPLLALDRLWLFLLLLSGSGF